MPKTLRTAEILHTTDKPSISFVTVTPETAERWLKSNTVNRPIREPKVRQYTADMQAGRWSHGADMICFSTDGLLLNGQHRLHAVVRSGCTITFAVQRNTPAEAMQNMDTGSARKVSDVLRWQGERLTTTLGAAAKLAMVIQDGRIYKTALDHSVSHGEIVDYIDLNPGIRESVSIGQAAYTHVDCTATVLAVAHFLIWQTNDLEDASTFLHRLSLRTEEPQGSAILALDRRLREIRRLRQTFAARDYIALIIRAWNFDATGQQVNKLHMVRTSPFRIPEPARRIPVRVNHA